MFLSTYVGGFITAACICCVMHITASDLQFNQCCCSPPKILRLFPSPTRKIHKS